MSASVVVVAFSKHFKYIYYVVYCCECSHSLLAGLGHVGKDHRRVRSNLQLAKIDLAGLANAGGICAVGGVVLAQIRDSHLLRQLGFGGKVASLRQLGGIVDHKVAGAARLEPVSIQKDELVMFVLNGIRIENSCNV